MVLGSNGEFPFLTSAERIEVLRTAKLEAAKAEKVLRHLPLLHLHSCAHVGPPFCAQETGHKLRLIAGTGCVSTRETIELTNAAKDLGYDAAMLVTPVRAPSLFPLYYVSPPSRRLVEVVSAVANYTLPHILSTTTPTRCKTISSITTPRYTLTRAHH